MKMFVGITDYDWFMTLKEAGADEVNFWKPGGATSFRALESGELFLFKLHSPRNFIVGGGFFLQFFSLPSSLAWEAFSIGNGARSLTELNLRVYKYKRTDHRSDPDPRIGCIILSQPFFFEEKDWIPVPEDWSPNIVQGKGYDSREPLGKRLYEEVIHRLTVKGVTNNTGVPGDADKRYGVEQLVRPRLGQGSFKVFVTEAYHRRCAITGEKTLPVLEAAHIKPYSIQGPHDIQNGLLLRRDFHTLYDRGYITIDRDLTVEVSRRIKEDFGNGREYYEHHGQKMLVVPKDRAQLPSPAFLDWHNNNVFLG